jgi:hypothetical protein
VEGGGWRVKGGGFRVKGRGFTEPAFEASPQPKFSLGFWVWVVGFRVCPRRRQLQEEIKSLKATKSGERHQKRTQLSLGCVHSLISTSHSGVLSFS